jgi:predicted dehydrogenase/threonine dehydrogenase-like Zn-dependent dehydrogenase
MKQIAQNKKTGTMTIENVPAPAMKQGMVLVKNYFSVISAGTEKTSIDSRKSSLFARAKSQPDEVKKVIDEVKRTGLTATYKRIMSKLDSSAALGYSTAGIVLAVDPEIQDIEIGDRVACAGADFASHSDVIVVPRNLVARIPDGVSMEAAAYSTLGAIALQGVRQVAPTLGETVVVIGLGLLGQLTVQFLKANGCTVIGIDLDPYVLELAKKSGADTVLHRIEDPVEAIVASMSHGYGADAVIITAGTKNNDPIELAGKITRERGRVVVVGATGMDIPRAPYYMKEIDIRLSRSYGPGRYNSAYELEGLDYPIGYVRWTENRNMQAFLQLLAENKMDTSILTTHRFPVDQALEAYNLIEGAKTTPYVGIILTYDDLPKEELKRITAATETVKEEVRISTKRSSLTVGFIGAGNFAMGYLLPNLQAIPDVTLDTVCDRIGLTSADMKNKFSFAHHTSNPEDVFGNDSIGSVFIATRHGDHAPYVLRALQSGQHAFVEKPLALNEAELSGIESYIMTHELQGKVTLLVGYNRRFSPLVIAMKDFFSSMKEPSIIHYYVNAGFLPKDHWTHDPVDGGGRIVGEVCHFIDTIQYLTGAQPERVHAESIRSANTAVTNHDNVNITLRMSDGSLGIITYASNGDSSIPKERIAMSCANATAIMDNFTALILAHGGRTTKKASPGDKGHKNEVLEFINAIRAKRSEVIPFASLLATSRATFAAQESLNSKEIITL